MRVIALSTLRAFWGRHPDAEAALRMWYRIASAARWRHLRDVHAVFPHADGVEAGRSGTLTVFNIDGNSYRLVVRIRYDYQLINIRCVLTHTEYDKGRWKD